MARNIEMNYKTSSGSYEVLYPATNITNVIDLQNQLNQKLSLTGGTMSGNLILNTSSPTNDLQAASKGYIDSKFSGINTQYELFCSFNSTEITSQTIKSNAVPETFLDVVFDGLITGSNMTAIYMGPDSSTNIPILCLSSGAVPGTNIPNQRFRFKFSIAPFYQYTNANNVSEATSLINRVSAIPTLYNGRIREFWSIAASAYALDRILSKLGVLVEGSSFTIGADSYLNVYIRQ